MIHTRSIGRQAVFVCCDGLGADWIGKEHTPSTRALAETSLWCRAHRAVFPSVTRVSAASVATGCYPARHGLHGNRMALLEGAGFTVRDVGKPDFREHMRRATGCTLRVPTVAERVAKLDGFIGLSNVSPGAAYFLDPEHFGHIYHRAGSFAPGGRALVGAEALGVSHDLEGDRAMTRRFCDEALGRCRPSVAVLWLANPDLTLHGAPLGSPDHLEALRIADSCVTEVIEAVAERRRHGAEVLLLVGSDHGQETIGDCVDVEDWLRHNGLAQELADGDIAMAGQGTAALFYTRPRARQALLGALDRLRAQAWIDEIALSADLERLGLSTDGGLVAAANMACGAWRNAYGVPGCRWTVSEPGKPAAIGCGQHGGWGSEETRPFLLLNAPGIAPGKIDRPTSLVDIAPTLLDFVGLPADGMDGQVAAPMEVTVRQFLTCCTVLLGLLGQAYLVGLPGQAWGQVASDKLVIGVMGDQSGVVSDVGGKGSVLAARMAVQQFGGTVLGRDIELLVADHQNKPDVAAAIARRWFDSEAVEAIVDLPHTGAVLGLQEIAREKRKSLLVSGAASVEITGQSCSPYTTHWTDDTYALANATVRAVTKAEGETWYFLTADYSFGHDLERDAAATIKTLGGSVLGSTRHPLSTQDFSSFLLQARTSHASNIGLASAGADTVNAIKQAKEYNIAADGQRLVALHAFVTDVDSLGLPTAQGLIIASGFYWDDTDSTREWSRRFMAQHGRMPTREQAGVYVSVLHYLKAVQAAGTSDAAAVNLAMRKLPVDRFGAPAEVRVDGRVIYDIGVYQVKTPAESLRPWDYYRRIATVPGNQAFRPISAGNCAFAQQAIR